MTGIKTQISSNYSKSEGTHREEGTGGSELLVANEKGTEITFTVQMNNV